MVDSQQHDSATGQKARAMGDGNNVDVQLDSTPGSKDQRAFVSTAEMRGGKFTAGILLVDGDKERFISDEKIVQQVNDAVKAIVADGKITRAEKTRLVDIYEDLANDGQLNHNAPAQKPDHSKNARG